MSVERRTVVVAREEDYSDRIGILIGQKSAEYSPSWPLLAVADPIMMRDRKEGDPVVPTLTIDKDCARRLMDGLWHAGIRPSSYVDFEQRYIQSLERLLQHGGAKPIGA